MEMSPRTIFELHSRLDSIDCARSLHISMRALEQESALLGFLQLANWRVTSNPVQCLCILTDQRQPFPNASIFRN